MPTLPLYVPPDGSPDAWHQVTAPGGYEWWRFDAKDPATDTQIVATFYDGFPFDPQYLRAYTAYRRRPTRHTPPTPADYPHVTAAVYRAGRALAQFATHSPRGSLVASTRQADVQLGPDAVHQTGDGRYHLECADAANALRLSLDFTPTWSRVPGERSILSRPMTGADHRWVVAAPHCRVTGAVRFTPAPGQPEQAFDFTGAGYHDHRYGTGPLGPGLRRRTSGRLLLDDLTVTFHAAEPLDRSCPAEIHVVVATAAGEADDATADWHVHAEHPVPAARLSIPKRVQVGRHLTLTDPRVIDASPRHLRATYTADYSGRRGTALCDVAGPATRF